MSSLTRRLSVTELSQRILEMAKTGVYRESVFEAFRPNATKKQIRAAIAHAKQFGLHSAPNLRDPELGTYYQVDLVKYESLQQALRASITFDQGEDLAKRIMEAAQTIRIMLMVSGGLTIVLTSLGAICLLLGRSHIGSAAWLGAFCVALVWFLQKNLAKKW